MTRVAVTGASGFIGRHVLAELRCRDIMCIPIRRGVLKGGGGADSARNWVNLDIFDAPSNPFEQIGCPDVLIHLAWGGLPNYQSMHHLDRELPAQFCFLRRVIEGGLKSLVVAGTCLEYGQRSGALAASMSARPVTAYGLAKDVLRKQLQLLRTTCHFELTWARLFYVFGEGQSPNSLYSVLKRAAEEGRAEVPMSPGEQLRDYSPVEVAARSLVDFATGSSGLGVVNVCSGKPISIRRLVEEWIEAHGWKFRPRFGALPYADYEPMAFWGIPYMGSEGLNAVVISPPGIQPA